MPIREITMTSSQAGRLNKECNFPDAKEGACQLLAGSSLINDDPWCTESHIVPDRRLMVHRIEPIPSHRMRRRTDSVSWDMDCYVSLLRKAREEALHPAICHSHPNSANFFSDQDDENESHLRDLLNRRNRNNGQLLISLLVRSGGPIQARVWSAGGPPEPISVRVIGRTFSHACPADAHSDNRVDAGFLRRQILALGTETVERLQDLRIGVVGCGGTGSAVSVLLARSGVGRLFLLDPDTVAESNLNRLHGSTRLDADNARSKVSVLKDHIEQMRLGTDVSVCQAPLADSTVARRLRSCDVIFGCTDDHLGRIILNRLAYFYLIPVIDTGLAVLPRTHSQAAHISGRVTVLRPGTACLLCRGVINPQRAREEGLRRRRPDEYNRQVKEGYITDIDIQTPVVATFTTETATAAVNELIAGIGGLRGEKGWASERTIRYDLDRCRPTGCEPRPGCSVCDEPDVWGIGDVEPLLDLSSL